MKQLSESEVLKRCIEKAVENGYPDVAALFPFRRWYIDSLLKEDSYFTVIFSHDFCKALWGEEVLGYPNAVFYQNKEVLSWEYHIQQLALAEDRISYLRQFVEEK